ncbi:MAG: hypothetical protein LQ339_004270 [Xanthoria mediterranea]|nr:MAG: hypothetical protein LQ339_004270 [Xanthoria mediterranea]
MMSLIRILVACLLAFSAAAIPVNSTEPDDTARISGSSPAASAPRLVRIFSAQTQIGDFLAPIPIAGGQRLVAPVTSGVIKGRALSGSILGGVTVIDIINSGQTLVNNVRSFGTTTGGTSFLIEENGIGSQADNFARLQLSIGGNQANLANEFLFTEATLSPDRRSVMTTAYRVVDR